MNNRPKSIEYFLDTTGNSKIFLKNALCYIFELEFTTKEYQYFKRICAGYNYNNEDRKILIAKEENTLYLVEKTMLNIQKGIKDGSIIFSIG